MRSTQTWPRIAKLNPRNAGAELELACGACDQTFVAHQHLMCGVPVGYHTCPHCQQDQDVAPELYEFALHQFSPQSEAISAGYPVLRFAANVPSPVSRNTRLTGGRPVVLYAPAHPLTRGELHADLARRSIALFRRLMTLVENVGDQILLKLRPDPEEACRRDVSADEEKLRANFGKWMAESVGTEPLFVDGCIETELAGADLLITHVGAPWIDAALKAGIEVMVLPLLPGAEGERIAPGALSLRDSQFGAAVEHWLERFKSKVTQSPQVPAKRDGNSLRILCAYREDVDGDGGAAIVLRETVESLKRRGHQVDITLAMDPDVAGYDIVNCFNIWLPETATQQVKNIRKKGVPIVWTPIYLDICELLWSGSFLTAMVKKHANEHDRYMAEFEAGNGLLGDYTRCGPNEFEAGFFEKLTNIVGMVDHVCVTSISEAKILHQRTRAASFPFTVVSHGVHAAPFRDATADLFVEKFGMKDFVLCVGAVDRRKNQFMVIEALKDQDLDIVFLGPAFEEDYVRVCNKIANNRVHVLGKQPQDIVASAFKAASVHVLPSYCEGAALANLEAAVAGCPMVVSNRSSEFEYFSDGVYYCDPSNRESIRESVLRAIRERDSRSVARQILARRIESLCDWDQAAKLTEAVYRSLVPVLT